jgi:hypothetical protein
LKHSDNDLLNSSEKRLLVLYSIVKMINFSMLRSIKLRNYLLKKSRLEDFFTLIKNTNLITNSNSSKLLCAVLNDINWLNKSAEKNKEDWKEMYYIYGNSKYCG